MSAITADSIDRESITVEAVFGLTGGELESEPLQLKDRAYRYWYEGVPDYVTSEFRNDRRPLKTVIVCELYGQISPPEGWSRVATYRSSGECPCPWCGEGTGNEEGRDDCTLCEGDGYLYLGDGWCEVVLAKEPVLARPEDYFDGFGVREPFDFGGERYVLAFVASPTRTYTYTYHFVLPADAVVNTDEHGEGDGLWWAQEQAVGIERTLQAMATLLQERLDPPYGSAVVLPGY